MRFTLVAAATVSCLLLDGQSPATAQEAAAPEIYWVQSPAQALKMARELQRPIVAFVTSENCHYCREMERKTWSHRQIVEHVEKDFVPLKIHAEREKALISTLRIQAFPTTIIFTPQGSAITGASGFLSPNHMAGLLRSVNRREQQAAHTPPASP